MNMYQKVKVYMPKDIMNAENRTIENQYYKELFKPLNNSYKVEYEKIA